MGRRLSPRDAPTIAMLWESGLIQIMTTPAAWKPRTARGPCGRAPVASRRAPAFAQTPHNGSKYWGQTLGRSGLRSTWVRGFLASGPRQRMI